MMNTNYHSVIHKPMFYSPCICLLILIRLASADPETSVVWQKCGQNSFTSGSVFERNFNTLLDSLVDNNIPSAGCKISSYGQTGNKIYGIIQCRADLILNDCRKCATVAKTDLVNACHNTSGLTQLDGCFLSFAYSVMTVSCQDGCIGARISTLNCFLRFEIYKFFNTSNLPQAATTSSSPTSHKRSKIPIIVGLLSAATGLLSIGTIVWKRKRVTRLVWNPGDFHNRRKKELIAAPLTNLKSAFEYDVLREATRNFHEENKLGEGGFGSGILNDGRDIAIKRLSWGLRQGDIEFLNESNLVSRVQHRNLMKLLGCCVEGSERLLVYEFLPNRSLDKILFDPKRKHLLEWKVRPEIIVGTARGLAYLHEESEIRIIHRDIKASNLLLDDKLKPKISDFGLARFIAEDLSHISTRVAGHCEGYMAPEYALHSQLTEKADVFSFGVLDVTTEQDQRLPVPTRPAFIDVENVVNLTAQSSGYKTSSTGAEAFSSVLQAR
eukprot:Gb_10536 [translate_table: standard]